MEETNKLTWADFYQVVKAPWQIGTIADHTKEFDNKKYLSYNVPGLTAEDIKIEKHFVNKTKRTYLSVLGEKEDTVTGCVSVVDFELDIDTSIYSKYETKVVNGVLVITLWEIKNKEPECRDISGLI